MPFGMTVPGRLGSDPEVKHTQGGQVLAKFRVAVNGYDREKKEKTTMWVDVTMWGARGEQIAKLLSKGDSVCFMGTGELREYNGKSYLECTASECALMGGAKRQEQAAPATAGRKPARIEPDDEVPF